MQNWKLNSDDQQQSRMSNLNPILRSMPDDEEWCEFQAENKSQEEASQADVPETQTFNPNEPNLSSFLQTD